jgi:two-component sensor histidine kinase
VPEDAVELYVSGEDVRVQLSQAVPLGMICNELITNTLKHVVPHQSTTTIHIEIQAGEGRSCTLMYDDGGPGLPLAEGFEDSASLGLRLVGRFAHQLKGAVSVDPDRKSRVRVRFNQAP